jgi:lipase maturation factor 1
MPSRAAPRRLLLAGIGLSFTAAFLSALGQVDGLIGPRGIAPVGATFRAAVAAWGPWRAGWAFPSLLWLGASDRALAVLCITGAVAGAVVVVGFAPRWALAVAWVLHLSLVSAGDVFWRFQWDALLSEAGLLAVLVAPAGLRPSWARSPPRPVWLLMQLLLVRLMVASGAVKLLSGDVTWRNLTALRYHFWTQPLPTPVGIWLARAPAGLLDILCAISVAVELLAPLCLLGPRPVRRAGALALALLQISIAVSGNYGFFNLLSLTLVVAMLDDRDLGAAGRLLLRGRTPSAAAPAGWALRLAAGALALLGGAVFVQGLGGPAPLAAVTYALSPLDAVNGYGLFAVMTQERDEIRLETSEDGTTWEPLRFRHKPDDRGASFVAPAMPRLDWQMWFAALGPCRASPWFLHFARKLLEGDPPVWRLLATSLPPRPPRYLRSVRRAVPPPAPGQAWPRFAPAVEPFCPVLALRNGRLVAVDVGPPGFEPGTNRL